VATTISTAVERPDSSAFTSVTESTVTEAATFGEQWAAWQARRAAHGRAARRRLAMVVPILLVIMLVVIYALLGQ
jgi:hypothetical protein